MSTQMIDEDEDEWEDDKALSDILKELPGGWQLVKISSYNHQTLLDIREWSKDNCLGQYREVNWSGACSYSTGMMFELDMDTILFKLRWGCAPL